ncbi:hypothetical protein EMCRGX_G008340 [Ephydatia muelleri]
MAAHVPRTLLILDPRDADPPPAFYATANTVLPGNSWGGGLLNTTTRYFTIFPDDIIPVWTDFTLPEAWYDVIWVQWVMAHLIVDSGVMSLDIHPEHPYLIAVGLYDGTVAVYTLKDKSFNPLYRSTAKTGWHLAGASPVNEGTVVWSQEKECLGEPRVVVKWNTCTEDKCTERETQHQLALVDQDYPKNRMNDGKCDARGRLWCGTMGYEKSPGEPVSSQGTLYCYHGGNTLSHLDGVTDVCISNGMAWSPGNTKMYHMDSGPRKLWSFNFDDVSSCLTNRQVCWWSSTCTDSEGRLWRAGFFGATIVLVGPSQGRAVGQDRVPSPLHDVMLLQGSRLQWTYQYSRPIFTHDRLALVLFEALFRFVCAWTNLQLMADRPLNIAIRMALLLGLISKVGEVLWISVACTFVHHTLLPLPQSQLCQYNLHLSTLNIVFNRTVGLGTYTLDTFVTFSSKYSSPSASIECIKSQDSTPKLLSTIVAQGPSPIFSTTGHTFWRIVVDQTTGLDNVTYEVMFIAAVN